MSTSTTRSRKAASTTTPEVTPEATPEVTPEAQPEVTPESTLDVLTREATEHAAWLKQVRERALQFCVDQGICTAGQAAFLSDVGIPNNPSSRRESTQPDIPADTLGVDPAWLTPDGIAGMLAKQREAHAKQRAKVARGIMRGAKSGYYTPATAGDEITALGLELPKRVTNGSVYLSHIYFFGLPEDVTSDQIKEAFSRVLSAAIGTYLPGWQHPEVAGVEVTTEKAYAVDSDASEDNWTF